MTMTHRRAPAALLMLLLLLPTACSTVSHGAAGELQSPAERLIAAYDRDPSSRASIARELIYDPWNQDGAAVDFLHHPRHDELLHEIVVGTVGEWEPDPTRARLLYHHLVVSIAHAIEAAADERAIASLLTDLDAVASHAFDIRADPRLINPANHRILREALRYAVVRPPVGAPGRVRLLNLYVPAISVPAGDLDLSYSTDYIERRIASLETQSAVCGLLYWYLSAGRLYPEFEFQILEGATATALNERGTSIEIMSVSPYPADLLYDEYREYAGVLWWFPSFDGVVYLSGPRPVVFVPWLLESMSRRMVSTMPSGAGYSVLVHELFHNVGGMIGVDAGHTYTIENEAAWPDWYRDIVAANNGAIAEYAWYAGLLDAYLAGTEEPFDRILEVSDDWMPSAQAFVQARDLSQTMGAAALASMRRKIVDANELIWAGDTEGGVALLGEVAESAPDAAPAQFALAYATHWALHDRERAQARYDSFLERFPGLPESNVALIYSMSWYTTRDPLRALDLYDRHAGNAVNDDQFSDIELLRVKSLIRSDMLEAAIEVAGELSANPRFTRATELQEVLDALE